MSAGWQSKASQIASSILKRTAFALPVLRIDKFAGLYYVFRKLIQRHFALRHHSAFVGVLHQQTFLPNRIFN
jgi:hypothetical protein